MKDEMSEQFDVFSNADAGILSGGRGSRIGNRDKAQLIYGDETFLQRKVRLLSPYFSEIIISAPSSPSVSACDCDISALGASQKSLQVVRDEVEGIGPLMGLAALLKKSSKELICITTVDAPFIIPELMCYLISKIGDADAHVPRWNGFPEPLFAVYRSSCLPAVQKSIAAHQRRIISFYKHITVKYTPEQIVRRFDPKGRSFININTMEDYERVVNSQEN